MHVSWRLTVCQCDFAQPCFFVLYQAPMRWRTLPGHDAGGTMRARKQLIHSPVPSTSPYYGKTCMPLGIGAWRQQQQDMVNHHSSKACVEAAPCQECRQPHQYITCGTRAVLRHSYPHLAPLLTRNTYYITNPTPSCAVQQQQQQLQPGHAPPWPHKEGKNPRAPCGDQQSPLPL